jgi:3-hydroxymyristoyl/3-hydroxydecanoyl-(acyl carrier protein) dehydratase
LLAEQEVFFRNLDGMAVQHREVTPGSGRLTTRATLTSVSVLGPMTLVNFDVACEAGGETVITLTTGFGFFPEAALANQVGLPMTPAERALVEQPGNLRIEMAERPAALFGGSARLASGRLLMLDRITGHWPNGGKAGLGLIRGEKVVEPREWFFKAHFFQDPVQPGSLGVEALIQLLQTLMLRDGMADGIPRPRFEPLALATETVWRYRGQVVPTNRVITTVVEVLERGRDYAIAAGTLLVDGRKIYHLPRFGMRIVAGEAPPPTRYVEELVLDPAVDTWLADHAPTYVIPALPMMVTADLLASAAARGGGGSGRRPGRTAVAGVAGCPRGSDVAFRSLGDRRGDAGHRLARGAGCAGAGAGRRAAARLFGRATAGHVCGGRHVPWPGVPADSAAVLGWPGRLGCHRGRCGERAQPAAEPAAARFRDPGDRG